MVHQSCLNSPLMKWLLWALMALLLILVATFTTLWLAPQLLISLVNSNTDYQISAKEVELAYFPPTIKFENLVVGSQGVSFAEFANLKATTTWSKLRSKEAPYATIHANDALVDLNKLPGSAEQQTANSQPTQLNLYELANGVRLSAENVVVKIDESSSVVVHQLNNQENKADGKPQLNINTSASYNNNDTNLNISGTTQLDGGDNGNRISMQLEQLDLNSFLTSSDSASNLEPKPATAIESKPKEAELDWTWMKNFGDTQLDLQISNLLWPNGTMKSLKANIELKEHIKLSASGNLDLELENDKSFSDFVSVETNLTPLAEVTDGADVSGSMTIQTKDANVSAQGQFNLNGISENSSDFELAMSSLPEAIELDPTLVSNYMPLRISGQLTIQDSQYTIRQLDSKFGESDLKGEVSANVSAADQTQLEFKLASKRLSYQAQTQEEVEPETVDESDAGTTPLFSDEAIDWSWMSSIVIDGILDVDSLLYGKSEFSNLSLPIVLNEQGLKIASLESDINSGSIAIAVDLSPSEQGVNANTSFDFKNIDMSKSNLFEQGEISGGLIDGSLNIESNGNSMSALAANSNGTLFANVGEGVIAQGSMDILGSDLILSTLSKLNPFAKSDKSTKLKCAVVNLKIEDGVLRAKHSVAMETSKVAIVGTGKVDLNTEKLDLSFDPKAKQSLGVSLSSLAKAVKLGGTLTKPKPVASALGIAETGLSVGAAVSTGGLSLLAEGLLDDVTADQACENARKAFDKKAITNETEENDPQVESVQTEAQTELQEELQEIELDTEPTPDTSDDL